MGLNIKNLEVEKLASEVAELAHETKTEAIRRALEERKARLRARSSKGGRKSLQAYLEQNVWPLIQETIPPGELGRVMTREEEDQILGYGAEGF